MPAHMLHPACITLVYLEFLLHATRSYNMQVSNSGERILGLAVKPSVRAVACREYSFSCVNMAGLRRAGITSLLVFDLILSCPACPAPRCLGAWACEGTPAATMDAKRKYCMLIFIFPPSCYAQKRGSPRDRDRAASRIRFEHMSSQFLSGCWAWRSAPALARTNNHQLPALQPM